MKLQITNKPGAAISKGMIGLFFEDINYGLDGGLHAEMIENRSFEFMKATGDRGSYSESHDGLYGWTAYPAEASGATLQIRAERPQNEVNPHYLAFTAGETQNAFTNKAYDGVSLKPGLTYEVSFYARAEGYAGGIEVSVEKNSAVKAQAVVATAVSGDWTRYTVQLSCDEPVSCGEFVIRLNAPGTVCFDFVSMIPSDAVLGLFRRDLVGLLEEMNPGFLRFPGGCIVEGYNLENRYQWKRSVGAAEQRKNNSSRWALHGNNEENQYTSEYSHYNQSLGIGFYEYFLLCEYLGARPIPVLNVGLACQFQSTEHVGVHDDDFQEYIQDALDLLEFANGPVDSPWGRLRSEMGHPEPFGLEMIGIGNEQWETEHADFFTRYDLFEEAIHARYPSVQLIGSAGPDVSSDNYTRAWEYYRKRAAGNPNFVYAVDEHYYVKPEWLCGNVHFYDQYPRDIKVFAGEYAGHYGNGMNSPHFNSWGAALAEAAFLTGLERNADIVVLASYAPLFARLGYTQWSPDMIWFDGESSYGTPSYYVQQMYSTLMGTKVLQTVHDQEEIPYTVSYDEEQQVLYVKLVNTLDRKVQVELETALSLTGRGVAYVMEGEETDVNSIKAPRNIAPKSEPLETSSRMVYTLEPKSFHVLRMECGVE